MIMNYDIVNSGDHNNEVNFEIKFLDVPLSLNQTKVVMSALSSVKNYETILGSEAI